MMHGSTHSGFRHGSGKAVECGFVMCSWVEIQGIDSCLDSASKVWWHCMAGQTAMLGDGGWRTRQRRADEICLPPPSLISPGEVIVHVYVRSCFGCRRLTFALKCSSDESGVRLFTTDYYQ